MPATYRGLDVSDKTTHICVVDGDGKVIWRGVCATDPEALATTLARRCPGLVRVVLETVRCPPSSIVRWRPSDEPGDLAGKTPPPSSAGGCPCGR